MSQYSSGMSQNRTNEEFSFIEALALPPKEHSHFQLKDSFEFPPTPITPTAPSMAATATHTGSSHFADPSSYTTPRAYAPRRAETMASVPQAQKQCLEMCRNTSKISDRVSVRLLEYLTTAKEPSQTLDNLAHGFLDTCQILFAIEAGLQEYCRTAQAFPAEVLAELEKKFRLTQTDLNVLDQQLIKVLEGERKGGMRRKFGQMFGGPDFHKMNSNLSRTRESLRISALMFQWSLGSEKVETTQGLGYTALAAALNRLDQKSDTQSVRMKQTNPSLHRIASSSELPSSTQHRFSDAQQPPLPPLPWADHSSPIQLEPSLMGSGPAHADMRATMSTDHRIHSPHSASSVQSNSRIQSGIAATADRDTMFDDSSSVIGHSSVDAERLLEEMAGLSVGSTKAVRLKAEPSSMPRWSPRNTGGAESGGMRSSLLSAIRGRNSKLVEQLLDRGAPAKAQAEFQPLREAALQSDVEALRLLLLFGADPNEADTHGVTPLSAAVEKNFFMGATLMLKYGADPNFTPASDIETPLATATIANNVNLVHLLLMYEGDANHLTAEGNTLLISAINKKTPKKLVDLLLDYGAGVNAKSREGKTALFEAITSNRVDIVTDLLEHGADPNLPGPKHPLWPSTYNAPVLKVLLAHGADSKKAPGNMELAASLNNIESVRLLLNAGVDPNAKKDGVYTPLCTSIRDDRGDIFKLLLSNGADPNTPASEYPAFKCVTHHRTHYLPALVAAGADLHSPKGIVEMAVASNNMESLNWLLDQGMNPNDRNPKGASPLTTSIREKRAEMVNLLLSRGADPNMRGEDWPVCMAVQNPPILKSILAVLAEPRAFKGVMEMAVVANQLESVKLLLAAGVSVEDKNGGVFSPLTSALRENRRDIVRYLISEGGADVNSPGEHLPVVKALRRFRGEDTEMLELLLEKGADPNKVYRGWNGIMQAVENGDLDVLKLIVKKCGVDLTVKDDLGHTVTEIAASRGWDEAVGVLVEYGNKQ
ncbi:Ankyrin repeat and KH domain-containing protein [Paramyrothecium foliicola]|nr:Ankyrin repeat and KH domain-containing protein [Paramyrothecium foliicola]